MYINYWVYIYICVSDAIYAPTYVHTHALHCIRIHSSRGITIEPPGVTSEISTWLQAARTQARAHLSTSQIHKTVRLAGSVIFSCECEKFNQREMIDLVGRKHNHCMTVWHSMTTRDCTILFLGTAPQLAKVWTVNLLWSQMPTMVAWRYHSWKSSWLFAKDARYKTLKNEVG